jgi:hypothetical protein
MISNFLTTFIYLFHHFFSVSFRRKLCDVVFLKALTVDRRLKLNRRNIANETVALLRTALDGDVADADLVCWNIMFVGDSSLFKNISMKNVFLVVYYLSNHLLSATKALLKLYFDF